MTIRLATEADLSAMLAIYAPYVRDDTASFEYRVPSAEAFAGRFARITARMPWLAAEEDGEVLGYAYADRPFGRSAYAWDAEASVYVRRDRRRAGVGAALYAELERRLTEMGFCNLFAVVTGANQSSLAFHERLGYVRVAELPRMGYKFGRWYSTVWLLKILREEPGEAPLPPADPKNC